MRDEGFRDWLTNVNGRPIAQQRDNVARVRRVEDALSVDMDAAYRSGRCESVLERLHVSNGAYLRTVQLPTDMAGLSSLKTAVRKYVSYCDWDVGQG